MRAGDSVMASTASTPAVAAEADRVLVGTGAEVVAGAKGSGDEGTGDSLEMDQSSSAMRFGGLS